MWRPSAAKAEILDQPRWCDWKSHPSRSVYFPNSSYGELGVAPFPVGLIFSVRIRRLGVAPFPVGLLFLTVCIRELEVVPFPLGLFLQEFVSELEVTSFPLGFISSGVVFDDWESHPSRSVYFCQQFVFGKASLRDDYGRMGDAKN
jgi:hypothetical protein